MIPGSTIRSLSRRVAALSVVFAAAVAVASADTPPVNANRRGVAIDGYDAVAYFTQGEAVKGRPEFSFTFEGAQFQFASAESRDTFAKDPARYAPQFGGYCAYAVSRGYTADTDPEAFSIVGDKLYLNYSKTVRRTWEKDRDENIRKGDANWPDVLKK